MGVVEKVSEIPLLALRARILPCQIEAKLVREVGLEPTRPKTQVPKTCVSAISPLPQVGSDHP